MHIQERSILWKKKVYLKYLTVEENWNSVKRTIKTPRTNQNLRKLAR